MDDFEKLLPTLTPELTHKEKIFARAFNGDSLYALRLAGYQGNDAYLLRLGKELLSRHEIRTAIAKYRERGEKKESAVLSKIERMEILSGIARNSDPYARMVKDEFGQDKEPEPPSISERIKAIDLLNKIEGDYQTNINVKHEHSLSEMVMKSFTEDTTPIDVIEAEYIKLKESEKDAPIEPAKEQGLFI